MGIHDRKMSLAKREKDFKQEENQFLVERLLESRTILLTEPITSELAEDVVGKLLLLDQEKEGAPIYMYINSPGGEIDAGFGLYDMMRFISSPITCISAGLTASAAVIVLLAAEKARRLSLPNSRFLLHQPSSGVRGSASDVQIEAGEILRIRERINRLIADATGQPLEKIERDTQRNFWMDADQAKQYGLVNKIVTSKGEVQK